MNKILTVESAIKITKEFRKKNKIVVIAGGCFDILHIGHIKFLKAAKRKGDILFILLESDNSVRKLKGEGRPINSQIERAQVLAGIEYINYIVLLKELKTNKAYDNLIKNLNPNIIATTKNDLQNVHNERQAKKIGAIVKYVTPKIKNKSTTKLAEIISNNFDK